MVVDAQAEHRRAVAGSPIPWGLDVSFEGRRPLEPGSAELSWHFRHGLEHDDDLNVLPLIGVHEGVSPETIELRVVREHRRGLRPSEDEADRDAAMRAVLRVAWAGPGRAASVGVGLRFVRSNVPASEYEVWDEPLRVIRLDSTSTQLTDPVHYDGSVVIRQLAAPTVPTVGEAWVLDAGTAYQLRYAIVNRSYTARSVRVVIHGSSRGRVDVEGDSDRVVEIAPSEAAEVGATLTVDEAGPCLPCMSVTVIDGQAPELPIDQIVLYATAE